MTVGTGTAGRYSSLADGLRRTIELIEPRKFWLVPSVSEDSQTIADLVSEGFDNVALLSPTERYWTVTEPDQLEICRKTLREVIGAVRRELQPGERLLINPTSGTKQMTAAATLAALDENIGDIVFTVGDRIDGVVKTGTERIVSFDASVYFRERDFNTANDLFAAGSFYAASRLLEPHKTILRQAYTTTLMCHHWQRFDYTKATSVASGLNESFRRALSIREHAVKGGSPAAEVLGDLLLWAQFALDHGDYDESLRLSYKSIEYAAKCRLAQQYNLAPDTGGFYSPEKLYALHPDFYSEFSRYAKPNLALGLSNLMTILEKLGDDLGRDWLGTRTHSANARPRNENTHAIRPIEKSEAQGLFNSVLPIIQRLFAMNPLEIPSKLPYFEQ